MADDVVSKAWDELHRIIEELRRRAIYARTSALTPDGEDEVLRLYAWVVVRHGRPFRPDQSKCWFARAAQLATAYYAGKDGTSAETFHAIMDRILFATLDLISEAAKAAK